MIARYKNGDTQ
ncbi:Protein of unknown function [Streptococcus thermophilus]|nr:Protein of unknown function [Streptococcus thermophilus]